MGSRPSSFRKSGGFLNNVDGVITGYTFTDEFNGEPFVPGRDPKTKREKFHALYCILSVRVDGADEDVPTTLFVGGAEDFDVSEDGLTLTSPKAGEPCSPSQNSAIGKFVASLVDAGFPADNFDEDEAVVNFEPMVGTRVRFVQRKDEETTKRLGKRKDKKTGKEYDRQDLVVDEVYEVGTGEVAAPAKGAKPGGKPKPGTKPAKGGAAPEVDLDELTKDTLLAILGDEKNNSIAKAKLSVKVLTRLMKHAKRQDVIKRIFEDEFLETEQGWAYNKAKQVVTLAADE